MATGARLISPYYPLLLPLLLTGVKAVQERHHKIEESHVGTEVSRQPDGLSAVRGLGLDVKSLPLEQGPQALPDDRVVVGEENPSPHLTSPGEP